MIEGTAAATEPGSALVPRGDLALVSLGKGVRGQVGRGFGEPQKQCTGGRGLGNPTGDQLREGSGKFRSVRYALRVTRSI